MRLLFSNRTTFGLGPVLLAWIPLVQATYAQQQPSIPKTAEELAPLIAHVIRAEKEKKGKVLEVAVFAFGNEEGKVSESLFLGSKMLQGELSTQLRNNTKRKFIVWDPFRTREQVESSKADVRQLNVKSWKAAAAELDKLGLDVAVVGSFQKSGKIHTDILFADGPPMQAASKKEVPTHPTEVVEVDTFSTLSTRFSVDVLVDGRPLPMFSAGRNMPSGKMYLALDRREHYGKPFTIRLKNNGSPSVGWISGEEIDETRRFFCAAVYVDGVNSFLEKEADGRYYPSQRHPDNVTKWVLAAPGWRVLRGYDSINNVGAQQWQGGDAGSVVDVKGFQRDSKTAAQFEFADAGESLAHEAGLTKDIGVISVYFYSEKAPGDVQRFPPGIAGAGAGIQIGNPIPQEVFRVRVHTHAKPVEIWNIYYRYRDSEDSIDKRRTDGESIVPVAAAERDMTGRYRQQAIQFGPDFDQRGNRNRGFTAFRPNVGNAAPGGRRVGSAGPR